MTRGGPARSRGGPLGRLRGALRARVRRSRSPEGPAPERPLPEGPASERPAPERPAPELLGTAAAEGEPRVVLYGRQGCHLCAQAREVVMAVASRTGARVHEVDVDAPARGDEPGGRPGALAAQYGELVPVVVVDGAQHAVYHVDAARLEAVLLLPPR